MTTVANCNDIYEASRLNMLLEAHGIAVFIPDENTARIDPPAFLSPSGVRVQVDDDDAVEARETIQDQAKQ